MSVESTLKTGLIRTLYSAIDIIDGMGRDDTLRRVENLICEALDELEDE